MKFGLKSTCLFVTLTLGLPGFLPVDFAAAEGTLFNGGTVLAGVPQPDIPKAVKGESCIAPTEFMRKNHMNLLKHDRDETVHLGNREIKASLKDCVACHAVNGADNIPVTVQDPKHFCRACHDYVAVKVDCFECHASRPELTLKSGLNPESAEAMALAAFVHDKEPLVEGSRQ